MAARSGAVLTIVDWRRVNKTALIDYLIWRSICDLLSGVEDSRNTITNMEHKRENRISPVITDKTATRETANLAATLKCGRRCRSGHLFR